MKIEVRCCAPQGKSSRDRRVAPHRKLLGTLEVEDDAAASASVVCTPVQGVDWWEDDDSKLSNAGVTHVRCPTHGVANLAVSVGALESAWRCKPKRIDA